MINYIMNLKMEHCVKKKKKKVLFCSCLPHSPHSHVGQQTHDVLQLDVSVRPKKVEGTLHLRLPVAPGQYCLTMRLLIKPQNEL